LPPPSSHTTVGTVPSTAVQLERASRCDSGLRRARHVPRPFDTQLPCSQRFRRLPSGAAPASQPSDLCLLGTSNAPRQRSSNRSALRRGGTVLRPQAVSALAGQCPGRADRQPTPTMASADFCQPLSPPCDGLSQTAGRQISQGKTRDFPPIHPPHIRRLAPDDIGLRVFTPSRPAGRRLRCGSCSSDQEFAFRFLQIPPRGGHPCGSARSSCHQGLRRNFHPASRIPVHFRSPVCSVRS